MKQAERIAAFGFDFNDGFLVTGQTLVDGREQRLQPLPCGFLGLFEAFVGAFEELALRRFESFRT